MRRENSLHARKCIFCSSEHLARCVQVDCLTMRVSFAASCNRIIFTRENSYCFQRVLTIAILSVRLSVCLSHGRISQKRCKLGSPDLYCRPPGRL